MVRVAHNKFTFQDVKKYVETHSKCTLLSTVYVKAVDDLLFRCECGEEFWTSFSKFKSRNKRKCNQCTNRKSLNLTEAKQEFIEAGLTPLFEQYKNRNERLEGKTKDGYMVLISIQQLRKSKRLAIFHSSNPYTIDNIKHYIELNGLQCELLSTEFLNNSQQKLRLRCACGKVFRANWASFYGRDKVQCFDCGVKNRSGQKHYCYNPELTKEERARRRLIDHTQNMRRFRKEVFERDNYTCSLCGARSKKGERVQLHAHHLNGYHWYQQGRFDPQNGTTLCENCHEKFHSIYGKGDNTIEQFKEFAGILS